MCDTKHDIRSYPLKPHVFLGDICNIVDGRAIKNYKHTGIYKNDNSRNVLEEN